MPSNISSSVTPFSSCPQSFLASGSFPMSWLFASGGQSIGASASASAPSNKYSGLISFRMDWFDVLAVQEALKNLLQHHNSKASILQWSAFFMAQLSHTYMTTGKTRALNRQTSVSKVMSLLFNTLARFGRNIDLPLTCLRSMGKPYCFLALTSMPATAYLPPGWLKVPDEGWIY